MKSISLFLLLAVGSLSVHAQHTLSITNTTSCTVTVTTKTSSSCGVPAPVSTTTINVPPLATTLCVGPAADEWYVCTCSDAGYVSCPNGQPSGVTVGDNGPCGLTKRSSFVITTSCNTCPVGTTVNAEWSNVNAMCPTAGESLELF